MRRKNPLLASGTTLVSKNHHDIHQSTFHWGRQSTVRDTCQQHGGAISFTTRWLTSSSIIDNNENDSDDDENDTGLLASTANHVSSNDPAPLLRVAVLGPPNAGKSTLFNRLMDKYENRAYKLQIEKGRRNGKGGKAARPKRRNRGKAATGGALISAIPGTTRDRRQAIGRIGDIRFLLYDTAGVDGIRLDAWYKGQRKRKARGYGKDDDEVDEDDDDTANDYQRPMMEQAVLAAQDSSVIFFVFDGRVGLTADDLETCRWLRRHVLDHTRVVMLANKLEGTVLDDNILYEEFLDEASRAGFGPAIPISALQGDGIADIAAFLFETQKELGLARDPNDIYVDDDEDEESSNKDDDMKQHPLQMAILGRPNVGKSTLVNALLQEHRVITGSRPGLTRDAIRVPWTWNGHAVQIVDTAGIRKASQRRDTSSTESVASTASRKYWNEPLLEDMAVQDAIRALQVADVAVLVIDAEERSLTKQDMAIADLIIQEGRVLVLVANKMDLVIDEDDPVDPYTRQDLAAGVRLQVEGRFPFLRKIPIIPLNSKTGSGVANDLMPVVLQARERWERKISTGKLNRWLAEVVQEHAPPAVNGRATKLKYLLQTKGRPPTFLLYTNQTSLPESYLRYLTRQFQESFDMYGMQVRIAIKKSTSSAGTNPFAPTKSQRGGFGIGGRDARSKRRTQKKRDERRKAQRKAEQKS
jgi:GTP-binding protein